MKTPSTELFDLVLSLQQNEKRYFMVFAKTLGGSGYDQKCYDSNFANTYYAGQYNSSTQQIMQYPHKRTQRKSLAGGIWRPTGVIPSSPVMNTTYSTTATFTVPTNYNDSRLYIVAYVALHGPTKLDQHVLNANDVKVSSSFSTSSATAVQEQENMLCINSIYPNLSTNFIGIAFTSLNGGMTSVEVKDISGRTVIAPEEEVNLTAGRYEKFMNVSSFRQGIYFLYLRSGSNISIQRFMVER